MASRRLLGFADTQSMSELALSAKYGGQLPDYIERGGFMMFWYDNELSANFGHVADLSRHIKHLHELQNLYFSLTGTELNYTPKQ